MSNEKPKPTQLIRINVAQDARGALLVHASVTLPGLSPRESGTAFAMAVVGANQAFDRFLEDMRNNDAHGDLDAAKAAKAYVECLAAPENQKPMAAASAHSNRPLTAAERAHVLKMRAESIEAMGTVPGLPPIPSLADPAKG